MGTFSLLPPALATPSHAYTNPCSIPSDTAQEVTMHTGARRPANPASIGLSGKYWGARRPANPASIGLSGKYWGESTSTTNQQAGSSVYWCPNPSDRPAQSDRSIPPPASLLPRTYCSHSSASSPSCSFSK